MKLVRLSLVLLAAACGGKSKPPAGGTVATQPTGGAVPAPWAEVFVENASFSLDNRRPDMEDEPYTVIAAVRAVTKQGDNTRAEITWKDGGGDDVMSTGLPTVVQVGPAGVWFATAAQGDDVEAALAGPPTFPAGAAKTHRDGYYDVATPSDDGTICYGWEPDENAGDCEDVCFASLCVKPGAGIVSGEGNWWPNAEMYQAVTP